MHSDLPIGMFDSGFGGLTVMQAIAHLLPEENIIYLGDTARLPYGEKSPEAVTRFAIENAEFLIEQKIKLLVIPCNTASAHALEILKKLFSLPILGVIEPGVSLAVSKASSKRIAILGTRGTIQSQVYQNKIQKILPEAIVKGFACPLFVPFVEEGYIHHRAMKIIAEEYLAPIIEEGFDTLLLGCTHYPLLRSLIEEIVGPKVAVIDSAQCCASYVLQTLEEHQIKRKSQERGAYRYFVSDNPEKFQIIGSKFLGSPIERVELRDCL